MTPHEVDRGRWARMTILEQTGNISSEVGRSLNAHRSGDVERFDQALSRALDLFDATVESERYFHDFAVAARANR